MEFPVDVLASVSHEELERSAHSYMSDLMYSDPDHGQYFTLTTGRKVRISLSNVGFVPLYGANLKHKVLALFAPEDQFTAVALLLDDQWYAVVDILRTADPSREGLVKVRSVGERIVLYVLNRIVYRTNEMSAGEVPFLCHGENDYAKILWKNGEAVGFYSVKPKGSLCSNFVSQCYLLPVMDSIFVRRGHRGKGHGLQMLEDFVDSFKDDELGMKFPLSPAMSKVCRHYLNRYPADVDLLWEVEGVGGPYQRTRVASKLSAHTLKGGLLSWGKDDSTNGQTTQDKVEMTEETSLDITEEIIVVNKRLKAAEEMDNTPISTRTRSSEHKRKKRMREQKEESAAESQPEKISRVEEPEPVLEPATVTLEVEGEKGGEEAEELPPADGVGEETVATEAPALELEPEGQAVEVNGELAKEQEEELNEEAEAEVAEEETQRSKETEPVLQNGTAGEEEEEEMDVEEQDAMDTVDTPEEAPTEEPREVGGEKPNEELAPVAEEHQEDVVSPAAEEEEGVDEDKLEEEAPPATEEELKEDGVSVAGEKEEEEEEPAEEIKELAFVDEEKLDAAPEAEEKPDSPPEAGEKQEVAPEAGEKQEVAPEAEEKQEVASLDEKVNETELPPAEESLEEATEAPSVGQQVQEEVMEAEESPVEQEGMTEASEEFPKEEESQPAAETGNSSSTVEQIGAEGNVAAVEEDECRGEGDEKISDKSPDASGPDVRVLRGARSKAVPPTPKRSSKRLTWKEQKEVLAEEEEKEEEEKATGEEEKAALEEEGAPAVEEMVTTEEEKVTTEEEEEHSSEEEEEEEPPVIDRRVLRGKIKVIQATSQPRAKRRSKI